MEIILRNNEHLTIVINGMRVGVSHTVDESGHAIQLGGIDCYLHGEAPGLYYPAPEERAATIK